MENLKLGKQNKEIADQLTMYPSSDKEMLFSFKSNSKQLKKQKEELPSKAIIFTYECRVDDSLIFNSQDNRQLSFRKSLDLSSDPNQEMHRSHLRHKAFSPVFEKGRATFSPLINDNKMNTVKGQNKGKAKC